MLFTDSEMFISPSKERQLELLGQRLLRLRDEERVRAYTGRGRDSYDIQKDIEDTEYQRKLLLEEMSVSPKSKTEADGANLSISAQNFVNYGAITNRVKKGDAKKEPKTLIALANSLRTLLTSNVGTLITVLVLFSAVAIGSVKYIPEINMPYGTFIFGQKSSESKTKESVAGKLDRTIFDLVRDLRGDITSDERVNTIEQIAGLKTQIEQGDVYDKGVGGLTLLIRGNASDGQYGGLIQCDFDSSWKQRLSLLKKGDPLKFSGTVLEFSLSQMWIVLDDCGLHQ